MGKYILKRLGMMLLTLFFIMTIGFCMMRAMPGGPYDDNPDLTPEQIEMLEAKLNLDKSIPEQYFLFRTNELWSTHQEEFIFLFSVNNLTKELFEQCRDYAYEEGMKLAHIGPGHMYTYITPVFVCETAEPEAVKALEKCKIYKSFKFSFHGWMDFHAACFEASERKLHFNHSGLCMKKNLEKILGTLR